MKAASKTNLQSKFSTTKIFFCIFSFVQVTLQKKKWEKKSYLHKLNNLWNI